MRNLLLTIAILWAAGCNAQTTVLPKTTVLPNSTAIGAPVQVAPPTFSPASVYVGASTSITITDVTVGAAITYCTGTTTCSPGTSYSTPVAWSATGYICAYATASGYTQSATTCWQGVLSGTWNLVQSGQCQPTSGTTCNLTGWAKGITANDLIVIIGDGGSGSLPFQVTNLTNGTGSYNLSSSGPLYWAPGCSTGIGSSRPNVVCEYILPSNNTGGTTSTLTLTFGNFVNGATQLGTPNLIVVYEFAPSANSSLVGLAADQSQYNATAGTTQSGPTITTSGTNPITVTSLWGSTGFTNQTSVAYPYSLYYFSNGAWLAHAAALTSTTPSWVLATSDNGIGNSMVFSFSPTAYILGTAVNWQGCSNGTSVTAACVQASLQGYEGGTIGGAANGSNVFDTTTTFPILSSFGPLNDGTTLTVGTYPSIKYTSTGSNTEIWNLNPIAGGQTNQQTYLSAPFSLGRWVKTDASCSVSFNVDVGALVNGVTSTVQEYMNETVSGSGGICHFKIETSQGSVQFSSFLSGNSYWLDLLYGGENNAAATFTNGSEIIGATNSFVAGQWVNLTGTGAGVLPTNFATGSVYCVSATNLTGSQFSVGATCGGALISAGSAGTSPWAVVYPPHSIKVYNATNITGATCTLGTTTLTTAGLPTDGNVITGITVYVENVTPSAWNGTFTNITVSGNNISYAQTCPGSAYSSGGAIVAQVGATQWGPANIGPMYFQQIKIGGVGQTNTSGNHVWAGAEKISYTGIDPLLP